jgi:hypothetical protein
VGAEHKPNFLFSNEQGWSGKTVLDVSGYRNWEIEQMGLRGWLRPIPAFRFTIFPDVSPTEKGVVVPTGIIADFDISSVPDWRRYIKGADMGCGMRVVPLAVTKENFADEPPKLDRVYQLLHDEGKMSCLRGNHFINFSVDVDTDYVHAVIHTGSTGDWQRRLTSSVDSPYDYDDLYMETLRSGLQSRSQIEQIIGDVYGFKGNSFDSVHNTVDIDNKKGVARVYKGVVAIKNNDSQQILPSSPSGLMVIYSPGERALEIGGTSHGTGRAIRRSDMRNFSIAKSPKIMIPRGLSWPVTEADDAYHPIDRSLDIMEGFGLIDRNNQRLLMPIAGIKSGAE